MARVLERVGGLLPVGVQGSGTLEQAFLLESLQRAQACGTGERMPRVGVAVEQLDAVGSLHESVVDRIPHEHRAHGHRTVGEPLRRRAQIGQDAEALGSERLAEAAETGDDFVEDEQDAMLGADFAQALEIALRRDQHPGRSGDRLHDQRGDARGIVQLANALQIVGELGAVRRLAAREGIARRVVRMADVVDPGDTRPEGLAVEGNAAHGHAAEVHAVIAALAADQPEALALAPGALVSQRDLERGVDRFGAGVGKEHP